MKNTITRACLILLTFTLTAGVALATTYNETITAGSGKLSYTATTTTIKCTYEKDSYTYYSVTYSGFSYTVSGATTGFSGEWPGYIIDSPYPKCGPKDTTTPIVLTAITAQVTFQPPTGFNNMDQLIGTATVVAGVTGFVNPKYKIVGIAYTVPGEQSYVQYTGTTMMGTSTSTSSSFSTTVASSIEICGGAGIGGNGTSVCGTYSNSFAQESDTSSSFSVSQSTTFVNQWYPLDGPQLDHGNDVVYVWVNPQAWYTMYPTSSTGATPLYWNGYTYDETDDSNNMEVIPLRLSWLLDPSLIPSGLQGRLLRAWAPNNTDGSGPAITNQDLLNIAAADPFSNPNYVVTIGSDGKTTTDDRFTQTTNGELYYLQGSNESYSWTYTTTDTEGQGGKNTYSEGFAIEVKNSGSFIAHISFDWKESTTFTWMDQWNSLMTQMMSQSNLVSIHGWTPPYSGPDEFNVFQDNIYGTFMVNPVPPQ
jgi:hypothetical protein